MGMMIKIDQEPRGFLAQRAIGSGFQSMLFSDCRSADEARECVRIVRPETPEDGGTPEYVQALRDIVVVLMIEKHGAVENLEEILSIDGVDMIQWGGSDYSMSVGRAGERNSPEIKAVERKVIETALKMGIPPRAEINTADQAKDYLDMGVRHFCIGTDITILFNWWKTQGDDLRNAIEGA
jgi:4-hydroxy-2-oxoheptanedioate aldolase